MTGTATWEQITALAGIIGVVIGAAIFLWARVEAARKTTRDELAAEQAARQAALAAEQKDRQAAIDKLRAEFNDHRVEVAQHYASQGMLDKVEERLGGSLDEMRTDIAGLRDEVMKVLRGGAPGWRATR